jgi:hypothetical protein
MWFTIISHIHSLFNIYILKRLNLFINVIEGLQKKKNDWRSTVLKNESVQCGHSF